MKSPVKYIQIHAILLAALVVLLHAVIPHHHHLDALSDHFAAESRSCTAESNNCTAESNPFTECTQNPSSSNHFPSEGNECSSSSNHNAEPCESSDEAKSHCHAFNHIAFNKANSVSVGLRAVPSSVWMVDVTKSTITDLHLSLVVNRLFEVENGSPLQLYAPTRLFRGPPSQA